MKYKKMVANLEAAKRWWDAQPESFKKATTRPGSVKMQNLLIEVNNHFEFKVK